MFRSVWISAFSSFTNAACRNEVSICFTDEVEVMGNSQVQELVEKDQQ